MNAPRFTFKKEERLTGKKLIDELFETGSSFYLQPFKIFFLEKEPSLNPSEEKAFPVKILISVPAKNFKRAVDRNKIRRLIREAYRLNKKFLYDTLKKNQRELILAFLYTSKSIESFSVIQSKLISVLIRLSGENGHVEKNSE
jgi:ribonuclease P protein component